VIEEAKNIKGIIVSIVPNEQRFNTNCFILLKFDNEKIYICMVESQYSRENDRIAHVMANGFPPMFRKYALLSGDANNIYINCLVNSVQIYQIDNNMQKVLKTILSVMSDSQMQEMMDNFAVCSRALASCFSELRKEIDMLREQNKVLHITNSEQEDIIRELRSKLDSLRDNDDPPRMAPASLDHDDE
jgi:predicted nucleic acid-binding protein